MLISQVISLAKAGELQQLALQDDDAVILGYINLGLVELYKRFILRTEEAIITMVGPLSPNATTYKIDGSDSRVDVDDSIDIMSIIAAYDENSAELSINNENDEYSILVPDFQTIQVPYPAEGERISIIYTAGPDWVSSPTDKLRIPISLLEALLHYVGYRGHGSVDGNIQSENNTHYQRFEASVLRAQALGVTTVDDISSLPTKMLGFK